MIVLFVVFDIILIVLVHKSYQEGEALLAYLIGLGLHLNSTRGRCVCIAG